MHRAPNMLFSAALAVSLAAPAAQAQSRQEAQAQVLSDEVIDQLRAKVSCKTELVTLGAQLAAETRAREAAETRAREMESRLAPDHE